METRPDTFAGRMKRFNRSLHLEASLPEGIEAMNPFRESPLALACADAFYDRFYGDDQRRWMILGINPGRFGGGLTGVPFTDFKRLQEICGIPAGGRSSHEPSSEFIYRMIAALGGASAFYQRFYINSVCPLGFVRRTAAGKWVNYNYYDDRALYQAVRPFIIRSIRNQIRLGCHTEQCFCLGKKNHQFLNALNKEFQFFQSITELPHPRYIVQYRRKEMDRFIAEYREKLR